MKIYRANIEIYDLKITEKTVVNRRLSVENTLTVEYESTEPLVLAIGDYVTIGAERYAITELPPYTLSRGIYKYNILLHGWLHTLEYFFIPDEGRDDFYYFGTLHDHIDYLLGILNGKFPGWTVVKPSMAAISTTPKNINYAGCSILGAFSRLCNKEEGYEIEFNVTCQEIVFAKAIRRETALTFEYGHNKGLYKIGREKLKNGKVFTRFYGYGGTTNMLDNQRLGFDEKYIEKNIALYGLRETTIKFDYIYPRRNGKITGDATLVAEGKANWTVQDTTMDFDLKEQIVEEAVIVFNTGLCAGNEFEIVDYDNATKLITFREYADTSQSPAYVLPSAVRYPKAGDEYFFKNIIMPESYRIAAKAELKQAVQEYAAKNCVPKHPYTIECDPRYIKRLEFVPQVGDVVKITDAPLGLSASIRITAVEFPVLLPYKVKLTISDDIIVSTAILQEINTKKNNDKIELIDRRAEVSARKQSKALTELENYMLDTEGYFDVAKFKALSIEARMLAVGLQSQNFTLSGIRVTPNSGNLTTVVVTAGTLTHASLELSGLGSTWAIAGETLSAPDTSKAYYIYAKCSKNTLQGTIKISETELKVEQFPNYYVFNLGVLYPQRAGESWRDYSATYGVTSVVGDQIYGGGIKALDGFNFVDLRAVAENGRFRLGDRNSSIDFGVTEPKTLTLLNTKLVSRGGNSSWLPVYRGSWTNAELYYAGETVTYNGSMYQCKVDTSAGTPPTNVTYWDKMVSKGMDGQDVDPATVKRLEFEATQKSAAAQKAAESYATAQIAAEKTRANAYADGVVTAEEARAIADAQAKADAAKDAAIAAAASDATAKSNAAKVAAETYALAKANLAEVTSKAYADGVVSSEEARAIADATAKANYAREAAITAAKEFDAAIKVGTRNYIAKQYLIDFNKAQAGVTTVGSDGDGIYYALDVALLYAYVGIKATQDIFRGKIKYKPNVQYTLSVKWKLPAIQSHNGLIIFFFYTDGSSSRMGIEQTQTAVVTQSMISDSGKTVARITTSYGIGPCTYIYNIQLTEGNRVVDFIQAPEDVVSDVINLIPNSSFLQGTNGYTPNQAVDLEITNGFLHATTTQTSSTPGVRFSVLKLDAGIYTFKIKCDRINIAKYYINIYKSDLSTLVESTSFDTVQITTDYTVQIAIPTFGEYILIIMWIAINEISGINIFNSCLCKGDINIQNYPLSPEDVEAAYKTYAEAQKQQAEITAAAYADGIVTKEEARAIADATNKANYAREAAITAAKEFDVAIKVGGQNLVKNSLVKETSSLYGFAVRNIIVQAGQQYIFSAEGCIDAQALADAKTLCVFIYNAKWNFSRLLEFSTLTPSISSIEFSAECTETLYIAAYLYPDAGSRVGKATVNWYMLQEGNKPTAWSPAPEDIIAQSISDSAKNLGFTKIENGLIQSNLIKLQRVGGQETAGISGIDKNSQGQTLPAFWAGGTYAQALNRQANVDIYHNGKSKLGRLFVNEDGSTVYKDTSNVDRIYITPERISALSDLTGRSTAETGVNTSSYSKTIILNTFNTNVLLGSIFVSKNSSDLIIKNIAISASIINNIPAGSAEANVMLYIQRDGAIFAWLDNVGVSYYAREESALSPSASKTIDTELKVAAGTYQLYAEVTLSSTSDMIDASCYVSTGRLAWQYIANISKSELGQNGMLSFRDINNYIYAAIENNLLNLVVKTKGKWDTPGVLAAYTVNNDGTITRRWGGMISNNNANRASTGVFDVPHQIGHTDYIATVTVNSNETFIGLIVTKNSNSVRIAIKGLDDGFWNYGFDIIIVGRNMV